MKMQHFSTGFKDFLINHKTRIIHLLLITAVTLVIYSNSLEGDFQLDDNHVVLNNEAITELSNFLTFHVWEKIIFNRQFARLTFAVNYSIHGYDLWGYHFFNIIIHIIAAIFVYLLIIELFNSKVLSEHKLKKYNGTIALFTALIFAVHPVQTEAVAYITQRMASLAAMFYFASLLFYLKARRVQIEKARIKPSIKLYIASAVSFILGNYSKEIILSIPIAITLMEFLFIRERNGKRNVKLIIAALGITVAASVLFILLRGFPRQQGTVDQWSYLFTQFNVLVTYLRILLVPVNLQVFYLYPVSHSILEPVTLLKFFLLVIIFSLGIYFSKKNVLISFAVFWFFITQIIESSVFPLQHVIFEYRIYPAVMSYGLILSCTAFYFIKKFNTAIMVMSIVVLIYSFGTYNRNFVWKDGVSLWADNIRKSPHNPKPYNYLGFYYLHKNQFDSALVYLNKSIKLDSNYVDPLNHRSIVYKETGKLNDALADLNKAIQIDSTYAMSFNNRGYVYQGLGEYDPAIKDFKTAIELNPKYHNAMKNLSVVLQNNKQFEDALIYAKKAVQLEPNNADYLNNRGNAYYSLEVLDSAEADFRQAVMINPSYSRGWNNIGVVYMKKELYNEAIRYINKSITINPKFTDAYFNRAYCLYHLDKIIPALNDLQKCFELSPSHTGARALYEKIASEYSR